MSRSTSVRAVLGPYPLVTLLSSRKAITLSLAGSDRGSPSRSGDELQRPLHSRSHLECGRAAARRAAVRAFVANVGHAVLNRPSATLIRRSRTNPTTPMVTMQGMIGSLIE